MAYRDIYYIRLLNPKTKYPTDMPILNPRNEPGPPQALTDITVILFLLGMYKAKL